MSTSKSFAQVTEPQLSSAEAPPLLNNHAENSSKFKAPSHSTVESIASFVNEGAVVS